MAVLLMNRKSDTRIRAPVGFRLTEEMRRIMDEDRGLQLVANAYDCTGEEVGSVGEAHTVVIMILDGEKVVFEEQVEGSPCMTPLKKQR